MCQSALLSFRDDNSRVGPEYIARAEEDTRISGTVAYQSAQLIAHATWHPWTSAPRRWYRTRHLARLLNIGLPSPATKADERARREWERETIRRGKTARKADEGEHTAGSQGRH